ncbi:hypothetical protein IFM89_029741 [Coptis chinensis]|uniref:Uncharacterized protein n=1 Tax=Coptis chinensis TaxID=261450 RepID=A0A835LWX1_9MAGN|nr:hypothetical protein IFM89_029741 [Coptis chinensis]
MLVTDGSSYPSFEKRCGSDHEEREEEEIMSSSLNLLLWVCLVFHFAWAVRARPYTKVFDVRKYGALGNGKIDCSKAFVKAWEEACVWEGDAIVYIPRGTYYAGVTIFIGGQKCKYQAVKFQVEGIVKAPTNLITGDGWIKFQYIERMTIDGGGTFDGQGALAWKHNDCIKNPHCKIPTAVTDKKKCYARNFTESLRFDFVTDSTVTRIHSVNSKGVHINVYGCRNMNFNSITLTAPEDSPNTDGIHIGDSSLISIMYSTIGTGDDCISLSPGSENIYVANVTCGPGHGISVGSIGGDDGEQNVKGLIVKNCTLIGTTNGVRIKTWAKSKPNLVANITFEDIFMNNVDNPIFIDQEYCPSGSCDTEHSSNVQIRDVHYRNIWGTSSTKLAVHFVCSQSLPCQNLELKRIYLRYNGKDGPVSASCTHARGDSFGKQTPASCLN